MEKKKALEAIAKRLRIHSIRMTTKAGSGHPTTCMSMADLTACLFFDEMKYNPKDPEDLANDELILSKGHAAPILWAAYAEAGIVSERGLMSLRKITSALEGHPTPRMKWVKGATGSLGQGLSVGVGMALAMKLAKSPGRVYVLMGDGECAEGAVWEAANMGSLLKLRNLCAIMDINRLGQSEETMHGHDVQAYKRKFQAFGWETIPITGHSIPEILNAFKKARQNAKPTVILAKTIKGKGVSFTEDKNGWHGKPLKAEEMKRALEELGPMPSIDAKKYVRKPRKMQGPQTVKKYNFKKNIYKDKTATRRAYGNALLNLGRVNDAVVALDGDVKNSTYADMFFDAFPKRAFQTYIAEQNMAGMGIGMSAKGYIPFIATFSAFLPRAHDQIRMAAYSFSNIKFCGSHSGVSIGADGPSQMGLEDLGMFRPIPGCAVLYPCDAYSTEACVESLAKYKGISYIRTTRPATPLIYSRGDKFPIGGSKVIKRSRNDVATVIAAGITVHEALKAYEELRRENISIRIIDAYSVQPIDKDNIIKEVGKTGKKVIVVEDHFQNGGLGDAVAQALNGKAEIVHLAVDDLPRSGKPEELLDKYGIDSGHIKNAVKKLVKR
ncbi:MAG: transketolase [Candidatus Aminicenantes bacterium]|nr:MAG: transketolase [Candidatus Aminicenantes bacterium]